MAGHLVGWRNRTIPRLQAMSRGEADPPPPFPDPTPGQLEELEARLNRFYHAWKRGRGARVFVYWQEEECWFLIRHGIVPSQLNDCLAIQRKDIIPPLDGC